MYIYARTVHTQQLMDLLNANKKNSLIVVMFVSVLEIIIHFFLWLKCQKEVLTLQPPMDYIQIFALVNKKFKNYVQKP